MVGGVWWRYEVEECGGGMWCVVIVIAVVLEEEEVMVVVVVVEVEERGVWWRYVLMANRAQHRIASSNQHAMTTESRGPRRV